MSDCNCPLHRLSKEERADRIDAAMDETVGDAQVLSTFLDDLTKEIVERIEEDLEMEI